MIDPNTYHLYAAMFDSFLAVNSSGDARASIDLYGEKPGAALRTWAAAHRIDVKPETMESFAVGGSWTILRVTMPGDVWPRIAVHLDDVLSLDPAPPTPAPIDEMEIAF